jgi:heptosyltransferase-2
VSAPPLPPDADAVAVVCPSWVGDTVMATPVFRAVRRHCAASRIVGVLRPGLAPLVDGLSEFDELVEGAYDRTGGLVATARRLRALRLDAILLLPNSFRTGLLARGAGAARRIGYRRDARGWLLTHAAPVPRAAAPVPTLQYYAELGAWAIGSPIDDRRLGLVVTDAQEEAGRRLLPRDDPFVLLNPGGNRADKRWPATRFAAIADALHAGRGLRPVVSGAPRERELARSVIEGMSADARAAAVDLADRGVDLGGLKAVARRAALMITNDTGPRHVAAALDTPVVSLFGPTDPRWTTLEGVRERILRAEPFLPETMVSDEHASACRIDRIAVGDVLHAASDLLAPAAPSRHA